MKIAERSSKSSVVQNVTNLLRTFYCKKKRKKKKKKRKNNAVFVFDKDMGIFIYCLINTKF